MPSKLSPDGRLDRLESLLVGIALEIHLIDTYSPSVRAVLKDLRAEVAARDAERKAEPIQE